MANENMCLLWSRYVHTLIVLLCILHTIYDVSIIFLETSTQHFIDDMRYLRHSPTVIQYNTWVMQYKTYTEEIHETHDIDM